ncbi:hypothetical protein ACVWZV_005274 [Bradyrhizobium sp. GM5.1]
MARKLSTKPRAVRARAARAQAIKRGKCLDCGRQTTFTREGDEYYMVHDEVWQRANPTGEGMLCVGCLEGRLGRQLSAEDFTDCPLNENMHGKSDRLIARLTTRRQLTGMYELLDALRAVIASGDPALRRSLAEVFAAYEDDFPEEFAWATGAQAPTLLSNLMLFCQPLNA